MQIQNNNIEVVVVLVVGIYVSKYANILSDAAQRSGEPAFLLGAGKTRSRFIFSCSQCLSVGL